MVVLALLVTAAAAQAAQRPWRVLGSGTAFGDFAVASATGHATEPNALGVRVAVSRRQATTVYAVIGCAKRGAIGTKHQQLTGRGPFERALGLPMARPDQCTIAVTASISKGGRLTVSALTR